jgi:2-C-methyl-D-erythritol 4-phosphate cytidylyltransferase
VVAPDRLDRDAAPAAGGAVVAGGATRSASVRAGLAAVPPDAAVVVVHDAARPLAPATLFAAVVDAVRDGADGAVPVVPVVDSLRRVGGGAVDRNEFVAVQTPQAFRADALRAAHAGNADASDDATLVEANGGKVVLVPGHPLNFKITSPHDLVIARALLDLEGRS